MAKKTRTELSTLAVNTNLPDNTSEQITPTTERAQLTEERDSVINYKDDLGGSSNAGKFLTVGADGESLTMVDEPSGVPDWVTFATAVSNLMMLKSGTNSAQIRYIHSDGTTLGATISYNQSAQTLLLSNSGSGNSEAVQIGGGVSLNTGGFTRLKVDNNGNLGIGVTPGGSDRFSVKSGGNSSSTFNTVLTNSSNATLLTVRDDGKAHFTPSGEFAALFENTNTTAGQHCYVDIESNGGSNGLAILRFITANGLCAIFGNQNNLNFNTDNSTRLTISSTGYATFSNDIDTPTVRQGGEIMISRGSNIVRVGSGSGSDSLEFYAGGSKRMSISTGGVVSIPNGIIFNNNTTGGTPNATNVTLNDYEEGTWTNPQIQGTTASGTISGGTILSHYTRIGNVVHAYVRFNGINVSNASGTIQITGLPYAAKTNTFPPTANFGINGLPKTSGSTQYFYLSTSNNLIGYEFNTGGNGTAWSIPTTATYYADISITYQV